MNKLLAFAAICLVAGALVAGLLVVGGPTQARHQKFDQTRMRDLQQLAEAIDCKIPVQIPLELNEDQIQAVCKGADKLNSLTDPNTKELYDFQLIDGELKICATFYDLAELKKTWRFRTGHPELEFGEKAGCIVKVFAGLDPA